jgi:hypothetical protein
MPAISWAWLPSIGEGADILLVVGGIMRIAVIVCGFFFLLGVGGWVLCRVGIGVGGRDQHFFASRAGSALLAAFLIGAIYAAILWGNSYFHPETWST